MRPRILALLLVTTTCLAQREHTPEGAFIERTYVSFDQYTLSWGNVSFTRSLPDTFTSGPFDNLRFEWENTDYLCLRAECGPDCWYSVLLPLNPDDAYVFYTRPLAYDTVNNFAAFPGIGDTLVTVEHIPSGAQRSLVTWDRCGDAENYACIRKVWFDPLRLEAYVAWYASGSPSHREAYSTERMMMISLRP